MRFRGLRDSALGHRKRVQLGTVSPRQPVPKYMVPASYVNGMPPTQQPQKRHTEESLAKMRVACRAAADMLSYAGSLVEVGVTGDDVDRLTHERMMEEGLYPSPYNYHGFPKSICFSVNDVVCHGIPDSRVVEDGDVVKIDISVFIDGYHGDNCRTFVAGTPSEDALHLIDTTKKALQAGINVVKAGERLCKVGTAIEEVVRANGCESVKEFAGHGISENLHMDPYVFHYAHSSDVMMEEGTTITLEPMVTLGSSQIEKSAVDGWTISTIDGSLSAQFEHTVLITKDGPEVLTTYEE